MDTDKGVAGDLWVKIHTHKILVVN